MTPLANLDRIQREMPSDSAGNAPKKSIDKTLMKKLAKQKAKEKVKYMNRRKQKQAERDGVPKEVVVAEAPSTEAPAPSWEKKSAEEEAIQYLQEFGTDGWKFKKVRQTWLLQHTYDREKITDDVFALLLDYLDGLKGMCRTKTFEEAEGIVKSKEEEGKEEPRYERALKVVQALSQ